jgi:hypothetical protein
MSAPRAATPRDAPQGLARLNLSRSRLKAALQRADRHSTGLVNEGVLNACLAEARVALEPMVLQEAVRRFGNGGGQVRWADLVKNLAIPSGQHVAWRWREGGGGGWV